MRSLTRLQPVLLAAGLTLAACDDSADPKAHLPTAPSAQLQASIVDGARVTESGTGTIRAGARVVALPAWSATATMSGGLAVQSPATSPLGALAIAQPNRLLLGASGGQRFASDVDDQGNQVDVVWTFTPDGGPARAVRMFVNGALRMVTEYRWSAGGGSYTVASATRHIYAGGVEKGSVAASVTAVQLFAVRPAPLDALARFGARVGRIFLPGDLEAQVFTGQCRTEFLEYVSATAILAGAIAALERDPANAALIAAVVAASARATIAEMRYWLCQQNAAERNGFGGGGGGGTGGGVTLTPIQCLVDPWAPGCNQNPLDRQ